MNATILYPTLARVKLEGHRAARFVRDPGPVTIERVDAADVPYENLGIIIRGGMIGMRITVTPLSPLVDAIGMFGTTRTSGVVTASLELWSDQPGPIPGATEAAPPARWACHFPKVRWWTPTLTGHVTEPVGTYTYNPEHIPTPNDPQTVLLSV